MTNTTPSFYGLKNFQTPQWRPPFKLTLFSLYFSGLFRGSTIDLLTLIPHIYFVYRVCTIHADSQLFIGHICTYRSKLETATENYFPSLRVFADEAKFWVSSCRQNGPSQLAPMHGMCTGKCMTYCFGEMTY